MDSNFVVTFPMVMSGLVSFGLAGLWYWIAKTNAKDALDAEKAEADRKAKEAMTHESFTQLHTRLDAERDKRELVLEKVHALELAQQSLVTHQELEQIYGRVDAIRKEVTDDVRSMTTQVIAALASRA